MNETQLKHARKRTLVSGSEELYDGLSIASVMEKLSKCPPDAALSIEQEYDYCGCYEQCNCKPTVTVQMSWSRQENDEEYAERMKQIDVVLEQDKAAAKTRRDNAKKARDKKKQEDLEEKRKVVNEIFKKHPELFADHVQQYPGLYLGDHITGGRGNY